MEMPAYKAHDYAIPMSEDKTYPFKGHAISVYWKNDKHPKGLGFEIVSHSQLAKWAKVNMREKWACEGYHMDRKGFFSFTSDYLELDIIINSLEGIQP